MVETLTNFAFEHMDSRKKLNGTLPNKKEFYSNLTMEDITDADNKHTKRVWRDFGIKNLGEYHNSYLEIDTL